MTSSLEEYIVNQYVVELKSPYEISENLIEKNISGYYPLKIRRLLKKLSIPLRDKSEAQKNCLNKNRSIHPTLGKTLSNTTKGRISASVAEKYSQESDSEKERRAEVSRVNWESRSPEQRSAMQASATEAILFAAKNGSKVERFLYNTLIERGYEVSMHARPLEYQPKLQCDLVVRNIHNGVVIEVDGLSHVEPIWGSDAFNRTQKSDSEKNTGVITAGLYMIRLHAYGHKITQSYCNKLLTKLVLVLETIKAEPIKPLSERLITVKGD